MVECCRKVSDEEFILAFESSCDDTSVAAVNLQGNILAESSYSQIMIHRKYGGVVPEVASRSHFEIINDLMTSVKEELKTKSIDLKGLKKVVSTVAPGLVGPLIVGSSFSRGFAFGKNVPWSGVHHLRGHLASVLLALDNKDQTLFEKSKIVFPAIVLLISGGHTQILWVDEKLNAKKLADTADDAAGECFDKCAKIMGLPYPGGPEIEKLALQMKNSQEAMKLFKILPQPKSKEGFSFSGLKTAVRILLEKNPELKSSPEFAWAFQECIGKTLLNSLNKSFENFNLEETQSFVFCGGVAANLRLRNLIQDWAQAQRLNFYSPPLKYATDNAAMIACAAWIQDSKYDLFEIQARMPLEG